MCHWSWVQRTRDASVKLAGHVSLINFSIKGFGFVKPKQNAVCSLTDEITAERILIAMQFLLCPV